MPVSALPPKPPALVCDAVATLVRERAGIALNRDKDYLIDGRLSILAKQRGFAGVTELVAAMGRPGIADAIVEAMTTNETMFFRDIRPFDALRQHYLPTLAARGGGLFRIWCAAAATGQEPYSLAMMLDAEPGLVAGRPWEIVATDISRDSLARARDGAYSHFEIQRGLPAPMMVRYFRRAGDGRWAIDAALKAKVRFAEHNLLNEPRQLGVFDLVLCRNVLIYFDPPTKGRVLHTVRTAMTEAGVLLLGSAESVLGIDAPFAAVPGRAGFFTVKA